MKSDIVNNFSKFLNSLSDTRKKVNLGNISFKIYYEMFRIREAQWKYKGDFERRRDHSTSEIFQDLIAHYLKRALPSNFNVILEEKSGKLMPDILIRKDNKNWSIIEIKTNIGWDRDLIKEGNHKVRLKQLNNEFKVPLKRVFYIFETIGNVGKDFERKVLNNEYRGDIFPLCKVLPSPYYIKEVREYRKFSDKEIKNLYSENKITDFKEIINTVINK